MVALFFVFFHDLEFSHDYHTQCQPTTVKDIWQHEGRTFLTQKKGRDQSEVSNRELKCGQYSSRVFSRLLCVVVNFFFFLSVSVCQRWSFCAQRPCELLLFRRLLLLLGLLSVPGFALPTGCTVVKLFLYCPGLTILNTDTEKLLLTRRSDQGKTAQGQKQSCLEGKQLTWVLTRSFSPLFWLSAPYHENIENSRHIGD